MLWEQERARIRLDIMKHEPRTRQVHGHRVEFADGQLPMLPALPVNVQGGSLNSYADEMGLTEFARGDPMSGLEQKLWLREEEEGRLRQEEEGRLRQEEEGRLRQKEEGRLREEEEGRLREEEDGRLHGEQHLDNMSKLQSWIEGPTGQNQKFSSDVSQQKECFSQLSNFFLFSFTGSA